jgi:hypothetical protein
MCPCSPTDVSFPTPTTPSGPSIPGFGIPFALPLPNISPFPPGFPEDLLDLFNKLQLLIPPGAIKPALNPNFGKDIFDGIMKMLDQFFPFLMLYKFFLPILNLIICIIEVLCALMNPFALISAINRLFSQCIPAFLNLFPIFALIIMIISLLLLLLQLIEYIIAQILKFINDILRNINALIKSFQDADANAVLAIAYKLGALLCVFQNLFVLLSIFNVIIEVIQDMLRLAFAIPPCGGSSTSDINSCCSPLTCPTIVQGDYTRNTGTFQYYPQAGVEISTIPFFGSQTLDLRSESWQIYDVRQDQAQAFTNIYDAFDITGVNPKPVFFPTDSNYNANTSPQQAAYTINLRLFYNPIEWGRIGIPRYIRFDNCIVLSVPTTNLTTYNNGTTNISNGVIELAGGSGFEDDGTTVLTGFNSNGITPNSSQATLENFIHTAPLFIKNPVSDILQPTDGYKFLDMTYTFQPNLAVLLSKQLTTLGCEPSVALNRAFINTAMFGNVATLTVALNDLVNGLNGQVFPNPLGAQQCLSNALTNLRTNISVEGVALFQATATTCLNTLQNDTNAALKSLVGIGFNPCQSTLARDPAIQFTSETITVTVNLNENNGLPLTQGMPVSVGNEIATQITPYITFGEITNFSYDGYQSFTAQISSATPGTGEIMVGFENQIICTNTLPADSSTPPTHTLQTLSYQFVYTPTSGITPLAPVGEDGGTDTGQPRRDDGDVSRQGADGGKDGR